MELPLECESSHIAWVFDFNIDWPWICSRRMHVFSKHVFSKHVFSNHVFSKRMFSTFCLFRNVSYFYKHGLFSKTRVGVAFSPLCASMVLCSIRELGPWDRQLTEAVSEEFAADMRLRPQFLIEGKPQTGLRTRSALIDSVCCVSRFFQTPTGYHKKWLECLCLISYDPSYVYELCLMSYLILMSYVDVILRSYDLTALVYVLLLQ